MLTLYFLLLFFELLILLFRMQTARVIRPLTIHHQLRQVHTILIQLRVDPEHLGIPFVTGFLFTLLARFDSTDPYTAQYNICEALRQQFDSLTFCEVSDATENVLYGLIAEVSLHLEDLLGALGLFQVFKRVLLDV